MPLTECVAERAPEQASISVCPVDALQHLDQSRNSIYTAAVVSARSVGSDPLVARERYESGYTQVRYVGS